MQVWGTASSIHTLIREVFGDVQIQEYTKLQELVDFSGNPGCILLLHTMFKDLESTWQDLEKFFLR